ncbi:MAG: putative Peptidoglycan domain protein [Bacteroidetes bacterium ADurb.Bin217]|nr:MAG: putative Peptidoglycan domain protein [Bacteroidetes bacterium ADurb.Bin217]
MNRFDKFMQIILLNEGGLSDNVNDSGGLTKYGISQKAYPKLNIRALTIEQAKAIYKRDYYDIVKAELIKDELLALHVFDMAVNAGCSRAAKLLQKTVGAPQDGIISNITLGKANAGKFVDKYIVERIMYYHSIAGWKNEVFFKGWINRVIINCKI